MGLVGFLAEVEQVRNVLPVVDRAAIQYGIEQGVPAALTQPSMARVLMAGLRLSAGEAFRRVRSAEHTAERRSMTGEPLGAFRPRLAAAQAEGVVTPEQVGLIDAALRKVDHCDPAAVTAGESCWSRPRGSWARRTWPWWRRGWWMRSTRTGSLPPMSGSTRSGGSST